MNEQIQFFKKVLLGAVVTATAGGLVPMQAQAEKHDGGGVLKIDEPSACEQSCAACETCTAADPSEWAKSLAFGFSLTDGNSNTTLLTIDGSISRDYNDNIWLFGATYGFGDAEIVTDSGEVIDDTTRDDFRAVASYKRLLSDRLYVGLTNNFLYDDIAGVDYRVSIFPSLGYFLIREDNLRFNIEVGPGYVFEELTSSEIIDGEVIESSESNDYFAPRVGERLEWDISETAKVFEEVNVTFDVDESDNILVDAQAGIEAAISTNLALVATVRNLYDGVPAAGLEKNDLSLITSLKVAF